MKMPNIRCTLLRVCLTHFSFGGVMGNTYVYHICAFNRHHHHVHVNLGVCRKIDFSRSFFSRTYTSTQQRSLFLISLSAPCKVFTAYPIHTLSQEKCNFIDPGSRVHLCTDSCRGRFKVGSSFQSQGMWCWFWWVLSDLPTVHQSSGTRSHNNF